MDTGDHAVQHIALHILGSEPDNLCFISKEEARVRGGIEALPFSAVGEALEVIPRTLCQNCGTDTIRVITKLRVRIE